ncbi:oxidoreductase [bacterium]|nr:MAG: oxidoreductase [bacterium]
MAVVNLSEKLLDLLAIADIVFAPTLIDTKYKDLKAMPDKSITLGIYHGAVRNSENEELAHIIRQKCQIVIAYGACAQFGGIPGLANDTTKENIFRTVYETTHSTDNPQKVYPQEEWSDDNGHKLNLPKFYERVKRLDEVIDVDYYVPACPPTYDMNLQILQMLSDFVAGKSELPPKGTVIASQKIVCDECPREKSEIVSMKDIKYITEIIPDEEKCFLEQGIICIGPATRAGCGAPCMEANMPCRGCMGPTAEMEDQGGAILSAIASIITPELEGLDEDILKLVDKIKDPLGYFYRFTLPTSLLDKTKQEE